MRITHAQTDAIIDEIMDKEKEAHEKKVKILASSPALERTARRVIKIRKDITQLEKEKNRLCNGGLGYSCPTSIKAIAYEIASNRLQEKMAFTFRDTVKQKVVLASIDAEDYNALIAKLKV
jgi:hypothetical protein